MANTLLSPESDEKKAASGADEKYAPRSDFSRKHDDLDVDPEQRRSEIDDLENSFAAPSAADDTVGSGYTGSNGGDLADRENNVVKQLNTRHPGWRKKGKHRKGWWTVKKARMAGVFGAIGATTTILGFTAVSGPAEWIHLSEVLKQMGFSNIENASDSRLGRAMSLFRYYNSDDVGDTRIGWLASQYKDRVFSNMKKIGITFDKFDGGYLKGLTINTNVENSPYEGTNAEKIAKIKADYTIDPDKNIVKVNQIADGKFVVRFTDLRTAVKAKPQKYMIRTTLNKLGYSKVGAAGRTRVLTRYFRVSWHPMVKLDRIFHQKVTLPIAARTKAFRDRVSDNVKGKIKSWVTTATGAQTEETNANGQKVMRPVGATDAAAITDSPGKFSQILAGLKTPGGAALGGTAAVTAVACMFKEVGDNAPEIEFEQAIVPAIRLATMIGIAMGDQTKSGVESSLEQQGAHHHFLYQKANKTKGIKASSWIDSKPIRAAMGVGGGIDMSKGLKDSMSGKRPGWLDWTQSSVMDGVCSTAAQVASIAISVGIAIVSGGTVSLVTGMITQGILSGPVVDYVSHLVAGDALDLNNLAGAQFGNVVAYGAVMAGSATALAMGGTKMSKRAVGEINTEVAAEERRQFESESFFDRMFNINDYRSLASIAIDTQTPSFSQNLLNATTGVASTIGTVFRLPFTLFSSTVNAAPLPYDYSFGTIIGFSDADLNNPAVADVWGNAEEVAKILDNNDQNGTPDYITKAYDCFGVKITNDNADGVWDVIPDHAVNFLNTDQYNYSDCADANDETWLKVRFFILDTGVLEGFSCAEFNDTISCQNNAAP